MTKSMVAGFLFCGERVLLVNKIVPDWQAGLWNAVGGKVEPDETPDACMIREFNEEAGLLITDWTCFCTEVAEDYEVHFFRSREFGSLPPVPDSNDVGEALAWCKIDNIGRGLPVVGNLQWLVPMALDWRDIVTVAYTRSDIRRKPQW